MRAFVRVVSMLAYAFAQMPAVLVYAQSESSPADTTPPVVSHIPLDVPMALNEPFLVRATVNDDGAVAFVRLFFRVEGTDSYRSVEMTPGKDGNFTATIPAHRASDRAIEYFIQAEDVAGNIGLRGGAFEPLRIADPSAVGPGEAASRFAMQTPATTEKPWYKKWWVWTIAGAVVIAAAAGGGGGGGGDEPPGTATITAPLP
jgi:hypothetical protein